MSPSCAEVRELAPELALGIVVGPERSEALTHIEQCALCRRAVTDLVEAADALVLAAPEAEPPSGFEARTLARMSLARPRPAWRSWRVLGAAAALVAASVMASVGLVRILDATGPATRPSAAVRDAAMVGGGGRWAGHAYTATASGRPWLLLSVEYAAGSGRYAIEAVDAGGRRTTVGSMTVEDGRGSWGGGVTGVDSVHTVRLVDANGRAVCEGRFARA